MDQGIEVKGLTVRFGNVTALEQVNLTLGENRIYGLLGRNGAGKSTLLNVIGNRLYPSEGRSSLMVRWGRITTAPREKCTIWEKKTFIRREPL